LASLVRVDSASKLDRGPEDSTRLDSTRVVAWRGHAGSSSPAGHGGRSNYWPLAKSWQVGFYPAGGWTGHWGYWGANLKGAPPRYSLACARYSLARIGAVVGSLTGLRATLRATHAPSGQGHLGPGRRGGGIWKVQCAARVSCALAGVPVGVHVCAWARVHRQT
jgi:hypothetical protein